MEAAFSGPLTYPRQRKTEVSFALPVVHCCRTVSGGRSFFYEIEFIF